MPLPAVVFTSRVEWAEPWQESLAWLTALLTADDDSEQRIQLRSATLPRRKLSFLAKALNAREAALLDNLVWGYQPQEIGIPVWPDALYLTSPAASTATSVSVDTASGGLADREYVNGGTVMFWRDPFTWKVQSVSSITLPGTLGVSATTNAWPLGTQIVPVTLGTIVQSLTRRRPTSPQGQIPITVECNALLDTSMAAAAAWSGSQLNGVDFFTTAPDRPQAPSTAFRRSIERQDGNTGPFSFYAPSNVPVLTHDYQWYLKGRSAIAQFKGFLQNRIGRCNACLIPTWDWDLELASAVLSTDATLTIVSCGYALDVFPTTSSRRTLGLISGTTVTPVTVTDAVDNGDGTETLTLSGAVGTAFPTDTMVSYLVPARLDKDDVTIEYKTNAFARCAMPFAEIPDQGSEIGGGGGGGGIGGGGGGTSDMVVLAAGPQYVGTTVSTLAGTLPGLNFLELRAWFSVDWILNSIATGNSTDWVGGFYVTDSAQSSKTMYASLAVPTLTSAGTIQWVLWGMGITLDGLYAGALTINISDLPAAGTIVLLAVDYDATLGFTMSFWNAQTGAQIGTTLNAGPGTGPTPPGNTSVWFGGSGADLVAEMDLDCVMLATAAASPPTQLPPRTPGADVLLLTTFDGGTLTSLAGPTLAFSGRVPVSYVAGGLAGTA